MTNKKPQDQIPTRIEPQYDRVTENITAAQGYKCYHMKILCAGSKILILGLFYRMNMDSSISRVSW